MITPSGDQENELLKLGKRLLGPLSTAWDQFLNLDPAIGVPLRDGTRAGVVTDLLVEATGIAFEGDEVWTFVEEQQLRFLRSEFAVVRFNKLNELQIPKRNDTIRSNQWKSGVMPSLPGLEPLFALQFGYIVSPTWSEIRAAAITQQYGDSVVWAQTYHPVESSIEPVEMPTELRPKRARLTEDKLYRQQEIEEARKRAEEEDGYQQRTDGGN